MSGKRKYTKKNSEYWESISKKLSSQSDSEFSYGAHSNIPQMGTEEFSPDFSGSPYYAEASSYSRTSSSGTKTTRSALGGRLDKVDRFSNIARFTVPYKYDKELGVSSRDAVILCQKAYANVAVFRNTIDLMSEFANSPIFLSGGSKKSKDLVKKWLKRVKIWKVKDQFFREYYRSGNIFFYKVKASFEQNEITKIKSIYTEASAKDITSRYILLNPADITCANGLSNESNNYRKILSKFELMQLQNRNTQQEKGIYNALPQNIRRHIDAGSFLPDGIYMELDPSLVRPVFYKKQDYEPFAIPFGYPVLDDINWKLELKKVDQAIARTVENVILLITMGAEPDKGGINYKHLAALQSIFANEKAGRVLVSDYTTKAEFVIPDLNKVLGPEKYKIVNEDIQQGLQNILFEDSKYANSAIKTKLFIKRLDDARNEFLQFLQEEIEEVCDSFGLRDYPKAMFVKTDISDDAALQKITTRLIELGILHPEDGIEAIRTHRFPDRDEMAESQRKLVDERKEGWYNPLVGGVPMMEGHESNTPTSIPAKDNGRPTSRASFSVENISKASKELLKLKQKAEEIARESYSKKKLSKEGKEILHKISESVFASSEIEDCENKLKSVINKDCKISDLEVLQGVKDIAAEFDMDYLEASFMYHSKKI
jgi:hypothetical protein